MGHGDRRGVYDALFGDLDDETRRRYRLGKTEGGDGGRAEEGRPGSVTPDVAAMRLRDLQRGDLIAIAKATVTQIGADRVTAVAGGVTFFGLLSLFPAITAFVSLYGLVADPDTITRHIDTLQRFLPSGALDIIRSQVESIAASPRSALSLAGIAGLLLAFYSANGGMKALLSALNVAFFQRETRGFLRLNLVAMCFTLGGLLTLALMLGVVAVVPVLLAMLPLSAGSEMLVTLVRWPVLFTVLILALAAVYRWGPATPNSRWRWISPGAVFAAVALVIASMLFSWYAANFANYNRTYGSLGAVIGLMMWLWLNATIVLVGAELNSEVERRMRRLAGEDVPDAAEA
ncbi:YihY/virulence factor BrkB family protein [Paracoccus salsus]|uniref:YihY/virulence factor BrkB family protein n=1 Tax=Paracoccus salsus TaxID=2911061 RepID=UPI001F376BE3|nr:YihY/virulence factor BrkB family protein [Paracoccus salsus]MCF3973898.1 YihY/virulence factor BrkB family protein [Paracoccus salsus]